ncbi:MAG: flagellar hook-length control protein FliK [Sporomusaceae bacterium]|nr:flagellar hook-length control protein FliK [Sporomusaceae bacterium]
MMKINAGLPVDPAATASISGQAEATNGPAASSQAALRSTVELIADGNIKMLLDALGKTLGEFNKLAGELPAEAAKEAQNLGRAAMGADTVVQRGLAAMVRGARSGGETTAAFAQTMADAALLSKAFPEGLMPETAAAATVFARALGESGDLTARLMTLVRQLIATPEDETTPLALAKALLAELPEDIKAPAVRAQIEKAAAALSRSIPDTVRQAAALHSLPELQEALVWQKVADSLPWLKMPTETLEQASRTLREMAGAINSSKQSAADTPGGQKVLVITMPVFFADGRAYPAYIHISRDREQADNPAAPVRETWLRMCVATDNLGVVDMVFHLRGEQQLSIRVTFSNREAGEEFRGVLPELRGALAESELTVADIAVVATTEK